MAVLAPPPIEGTGLPGDSLRVACDLVIATGNLLLGSPGADLEAIEWLMGRHSDWDGLYAFLPASLRGRMRRAACDLALSNDGGDEILAAAGLAPLLADQFIRALGVA